MISALRAASRLASGSSISSRCGCASSARPMATRWRSPPDSVCGRRASRCADAEQFHHLVEPHRSLSRRGAARSADWSRPTCAGTAARPGTPDRCGVAPAAATTPDAVSASTCVVDRDAALVRPQQSGGRRDDRGLAGAGRPEQHRHARRRHLERHVHLHRRKAVAQQNAEAHRPSMAFNRLPIHSDSSSPISASVSDTSDSSAAFASPPGTCSAA